MEWKRKTLKVIRRREKEDEELHTVEEGRRKI